MKNKGGRPKTLTRPWRTFSLDCFVDQIRQLDRLARLRKTHRSVLVREALDLFLADNMPFLQLHDTDERAA